MARNVTEHVAAMGAGLENVFVTPAGRPRRTGSTPLVYGDVVVIRGCRDDRIGGPPGAA